MDKLVFDERDQKVDIHVSSSRDTPVRPETRERGTLYDRRKAHSWRYRDWLQVNDWFTVGFHEKIKEVTIIGSGYRKFETLRSAILFFCRNLELDPRQS